MDPAAVETYVLQPGDTLGGLSERFGMSVKDLKKLNGFRDPDVIVAGQSIIHFKGSLK